MKSKSSKYESRKQALLDRQKTEAQNRDKGGGGGKTYLNTANHSVTWFKPEAGVNKISIVPYVIATDRHPQKLAKDGFDYKLDFYLHKNVGPNEETVVCPKETYNKRCPVCEEKQKLQVTHEWDDPEVKALKPTRKSLYNVLPASGELAGEACLWEVSHFLFEKELLEEAENGADEFITFADLEDGRIIVFRATEEVFKKAKYFKYKKFDFETRKPISEDVADSMIPLDSILVLLSYDAIKNIFEGIETEEEDEAEEEVTPVKRKAKRTPEPIEDDEVPFDDGKYPADEEEEEEEEEKPVRRAKPKRKVEPAPVEEDEDEDEEEEEEKPKPARRKARATPAAKGPQCPVKQGIFGKSCNELAECADCDDDLYDACEAAQSESESN